MIVRSRLGCWVGWAQGSMGFTLAPPAKYDWTIHMRQLCGLFVKLLWPLVKFWDPLLIFGICDASRFKFDTQTYHATGQLIMSIVLPLNDSRVSCVFYLNELWSLCFWAAHCCFDWFAACVWILWSINTHLPQHRWREIRSWRSDATVYD